MLPPLSTARVLPLISESELDASLSPSRPRSPAQSLKALPADLSPSSVTSPVSPRYSMPPKPATINGAVSPLASPRSSLSGVASLSQPQAGGGGGSFFGSSSNVPELPMRSPSVVAARMDRARSASPPPPPASYRRRSQPDAALTGATAAAAAAAAALTPDSVNFPPVSASSSTSFSSSTAAMASPVKGAWANNSQTLRASLSRQASPVKSPGPRTPSKSTYHGTSGFHSFSFLLFVFPSYIGGRGGMHESIILLCRCGVPFQGTLGFFADQPSNRSQSRCHHFSFQPGLCRVWDGLSSKQSVEA